MPRAMILGSRCPAWVNYVLPLSAVASNVGDVGSSAPPTGDLGGHQDAAGNLSNPYLAVSNDMSLAFSSKPLSPEHPFAARQNRKTQLLRSLKVLLAKVPFGANITTAAV